MFATFSRSTGPTNPRRLARGLLIAAVASTLGLASVAFADQPFQRIALPTEVPEVVARSKDLGPSDPNRAVHVAVSLPYADPAGMAAFVDSVSDPASPNYLHFLTPEEVGARFGLPDKQVQSVAEHLKSAGLNVTLVGKNRLSILAEGTVAQAEKAFGTSIHDFQTLRNDEPGNSQYFSHTTAPTLPAAIASSVIDVAGLESFTKPQPRILTPTQARTLYDTVPMYSAGTQGQGRTVGISSFDGFSLTNVPLYYSHFGLPTPSVGLGNNITVVAISGGAGGGNAGGEGDLDIQMALGMAPLCNLRIYDGGGGNMIGVLTQEVNDNAADVITESYGWNLATSTATSAHNLHMSMSAQGITYMAATGDNGTSLEPYSYPDYEPEVLQVGGTVASVNGSGVRSSETGWSGSGGGWSTKSVAFNVLPSWQHGTGVPTTPNKRLLPDVALSASGSSGAYYFYYGGSLSAGSVGTSFASPVFAGSLAVAEQQIISQGGLPANAAGKQRFGRIQDLIYSQNGRSDVWFDVTSGSNGNLPSGTASTAGAGWDTVTGWGAINFNAFVAAVVPSCAPPSIVSNPTSEAVCLGGPATFGVNATGTLLSYQWLDGTTQLSDGPTATGAVISGSTTHMITITGTQTGDAGSYSCVVSNTCQQTVQVQSQGASLTVSSEPMITQQPVSQTVCAGGTAVFTCSTSGGSGLTFHWQWTPPHSGTPINVVEGVNNDPTSGLLAFTAVGSQTASLSCGGFANSFRIGQTMPFTCTVTSPCTNQSTNSASADICLADFDCSGMVTVQDIFDYLAAWFSGDPRADFNQDGNLNVGDIFSFLGAWFGGC